MKISFLIVVRHDAAMLEQRLREIDPFVDEIVVVHDGECEDGSVDVARRFTDKVIVAPHEGYCEPQRQVGLLECSGDWVLVGDADEEFELDFRNALYHWAKVSTQSRCDGLVLNRKELNLGGQVTKHCRFFKRGVAYFSDIIHTNVQGVERYLRIPGVHFVHYSRTDGDADPEAVLEKKRRYATVQKRLREKYADQPEVLQHLSVDYGVEV